MWVKFCFGLMAVEYIALTARGGGWSAAYVAFDCVEYFAASVLHTHTCIRDWCSTCWLDSVEQFTSPSPHCCVARACVSSSLVWLNDTARWVARVHFARRAVIVREASMFERLLGVSKGLTGSRQRSTKTKQKKTHRKGTPTEGDHCAGGWVGGTSRMHV